MNKWKKWKVKKLPIDEDILVCMDDGAVTEAYISQSSDGDIYWNLLTLDSHGCGCCGGGNETPIAWKRKDPAPTWMEKHND